MKICKDLSVNTVDSVNMIFLRNRSASYFLVSFSVTDDNAKKLAQNTINAKGMSLSTEK